MLEIGAGSGLLSYFTTKVLSFDEYICSDLSKNMLDRARNLLSLKVGNPSGIKFEIVDLYQTSNIGPKFDLIIGTDVIHHLEDPEDVLGKLKAIMNPGGRLVILETNIQNPLAWLNVIGREHEMRAILNTRENLQNWLTNSGWSKVSVAPAPSFTPAGPRVLHSFLGFIDWLAVKIPKLNQIAALWKLSAQA